MRMAQRTVHSARFSLAACAAVVGLCFWGSVAHAATAPNTLSQTADPGSRAAEARAARLERSRRWMPPAPRLAPVLSRSALDRLSREGRSALWVFFTDKAIPNERAFGAALDGAGERLTSRARDRRAREQGGRYVPDYDDVPVPDSYVGALTETGATLRHVSKWLNAASVVVDEAQARRIAALPFVRAILPLRLSRHVRTVGEKSPEQEGEPLQNEEGSRERGEGPTQQAPGEPLRSVTLPRPTQYGLSITQLQGINAIAAHDSGYSGAGVILAMFDTGYNKSHSATVQLKRIAERDFIFGDGETANQATDGASQWEHGTGTWSVAGGYWINQLIGPAYNATFALAKTEYVPTETAVEEDHWMAAAEWADSLGADVISSSLAYLDFDGTANDYTYADLDGHTTVVAQGAVFAHRRGILVANAMGNEGPGVGSIWSPADADSILSCGAVNSAGDIAAFSSRGPTADGRVKPEVVAQGVATFWAVASNNFSITTANGTSLATPLVAGAAALVREAHPEWTVGQVREALQSTADRAGAPNNDYGSGRINVFLAIYGSALGGPVYPKPFDLLTPPNNGMVSSVPVTLRWRRTVDPNPGDAITYAVTVRSVSNNQVIFSQSTIDTSIVVSAYFGPSKTYEWNVVATDLLNHGRDAREPFRFTTGATTDVVIPPSASRVTLEQNRPNPFLAVTEIPFTLEGTGAPQSTTLRIFDSQGRLVRTLLDSAEPTARRYGLSWDGLDQRGRPAAAGIYYYRLRSAGRELTRRLVLLR